MQIKPFVPTQPTGIAAAVHVAFKVMGLAKPIQFTVIKAPAGKVLTKGYSKCEDGQLVKARITSFGNAQYHRLKLATFDEFVHFLNGATAREAHLYGIFDGAPTGKLVTERFREREKADQKSRTKQFVDFPTGPAIVAIDVDVTMPRNEVISALLSAAPHLRTTTVIWAASASACIHDSETGDEIRGLTGQRFYFAVCDGRDIPRLFAVLAARLYLAGQGHFIVSASGALLERSLADCAMARPTQPNFLAPAVLGPGLESRRPPAEVLWFGSLLDSRLSFQDLSEKESKEYDAMRSADKAKLADEAAAVRTQWIASRVQEVAENILTAKNQSPADIKALATAKNSAKDILIRAAEQRYLEHDFVIRLEDGTALTVGELLRHADRYDGAFCFDPLEPDYDGGRAVGKLYLKGKSPTLHSLAHGGASYSLVKHNTVIVVCAGERSRCVEDTLAAMRNDPRMYLMGPAVVRVEEDGSQLSFTPATLVHRLGVDFRYITEKYDAEGGIDFVNVNPPLQIGKVIIEQGQANRLPQLNAVITAPIMLPSGRLLSTPGFDSDTGLFFQPREEDNWDGIRAESSIEELRHAFDILWAPLAEYPWKDDLSRGVALAMLFTAICRPGFFIAPAFAVSASLQSSGKTFATQAAAALLLGEIPAVTAIEDTERGGAAELSKAILAAVLAGKIVYLIDNVEGYFELPTLAAFVTGGKVEGRILGLSKLSGAVPFRMFLGLSGNNLQLGQDMAQRVLVAVIEPQTESPELREFSFNPAEYALAHRQEIITAGLTLLNSFVSAGMPVVAPGTSRFKDWDRLVRQAVVWLAHTLELDFADPLGSVQQFKQEDTAREMLGEFLRVLYVLWGTRIWTTGDLHHLLEDIASVRENLHREGRLAGFDGNRRQLLDLVTSWSRNGRLPTLQSLGIILRNRRGKRVNGLVLERAGEQHGGVSCWKIVKTE